MACHFRAQGNNFDVDHFMNQSPWKSFADIWRKGEPKTIGNSTREYSSISLTVTENDDASITKQIADCRTFIQQNQEELQRLRVYSETIHLWFSLSYYLPIGEVYAICPYFEKDFLNDLTKIGAEFELNVFCCAVE